MTLSATDLKELELALAERLYLQVASWHLYLGDAGLAQALAIECSARLDQGAEVCARQALEVGGQHAQVTRGQRRNRRHQRHPAGRGLGSAT